MVASSLEVLGSINYYYRSRSDKIMDALFQGQSAEQMPQPFCDTDFEGLHWPATRSCIFLIRMIVRSRLGLISAFRLCLGLFYTVYVV